MKTTINSKKQSGFTIIEVMIVLAIAALIMVIVFLAVPALQRSSRNQSRKTDANNSLAALSEYVSNNSGALPTSACSGAGTGTGQCDFLSNVKLGYFNAVNISYAPTPFAAPATPSKNQMIISAGGTCASAGVPPTNGGNTRGFSVYYGIEGNPSTQCLSD